MPWRTLIATEAVALPIGLSVLDIWRAGLLALLVSLSVLVLVWTGKAARECSRQQAARRLAFKELQRSITVPNSTKQAGAAET